jgi:hypothetical protein
MCNTGLHIYILIYFRGFLIFPDVAPPYSLSIKGLSLEAGSNIHLHQGDFGDVQVALNGGISSTNAIVLHPQHPHSLTPIPRI